LQPSREASVDRAKSVAHATLASGNALTCRTICAGHWATIRRAARPSWHHEMRASMRLAQLARVRTLVARSLLDGDSLNDVVRGLVDSARAGKERHTRVILNRREVRCSTLLSSASPADQSRLAGLERAAPPRSKHGRSSPSVRSTGPAAAALRRAAGRSRRRARCRRRRRCARPRPRGGRSAGRTRCS
jgi:hypothetical protein